VTSSADFYASPRIDPKGGRLAWLSWNHPNMPWDGVQLHVAPFESDGRLGQARLAAGGENESIFQPEWSPDGVLYFVSDRTNWWNLYRLTDRGVEAIAPMEAEFGLPQWVFGLTTYGFAADGSIIAIYTTSGVWKMLRIQPDSKQTEEIPLPYNNLSGLRVGERKATLLAGSPTQGQTLVEVDWSMGAVQAIRQASPVTVDLEYVSIPETIEFPTDGEKTGHAFYYPPKNRDFVGPEGEAPPLIIIVHGGPTSASRARFDLSIQFWTTRGFGVCDVNYGGSTGYGREYRNRLRKAWGIVDVADAANAALYLAEQKKADRNKLVIRGGSAGGYTTLACLAFRDVFRCGASYFGISDLALMASDTHKFESRYLDGLIGRYPEEEHIYQQRSPIHHLEGFNQPVLLLQGLEDKVVPPNQAEAIFDALKTKGIPVAYVPFEGEQHGFRKAETIIRAHEAELYFYSRILGFSLPEPIEPIEILNLP
jgi:dipeptidyl aminopeptidase/acylaminoacyl peptidase